MMCTPVPLGETSVYDARESMISCAHPSILPVSGSRQSSRSTPQYGSSSEKTNPTPSRPLRSAWLADSSTVPHVSRAFFGFSRSLTFALAPVLGFTGSLLRRATRCESSRSSAGTLFFNRDRKSLPWSVSRVMSFGVVPPNLFSFSTIAPTRSWLAPLRHLLPALGYWVPQG